MYHQDWLIRQIQRMTQVIAQIFFHKNDPTYEIKNESTLTETDLLFNRLLELLTDSKINEAENLLYENLQTDHLEFLLVALDFYARLNELDDATLEKNNFSREEISQGLNDVKDLFGIAL